MELTKEDFKGLIEQWNRIESYAKKAAEQTDTILIKLEHLKTAFDKINPGNLAESFEEVQNAISAVKTEVTGIKTFASGMQFETRVKVQKTLEK